MIKVEGFKAFHGVMRITPKSKCVPPKDIEGDWLYKPEYKCWYGNGASYGEDICTVVRDDSEKLIPKKITHEATLFRCCTCPSCGNVVDEFTEFAGRRMRVISAYCKFCGQSLDWSDV